jgi:hypothetical protein
MMRIGFVTDLDLCEDLWHAYVEPRLISDTWGYRLCFHRHFKNDVRFLLIEDSQGVAALLPLSYVRQTEMFVAFPGEVWNGKTWSERNPVYFREPQFLFEVLHACPDRTYLRYLEFSFDGLLSGADLDELGYVLYPGELGYDVDRYIQRFSRKRFKDINKTIGSLLGREHRFHINRLNDFDLMVQMSVNFFGTNSYLHDPRFRESLRDLMYALHRTGRLHMVSLDIEGRTAAVDLGALHNNIYTVFLGGTDPLYLGVAKVMNMHHIRFACEQRLAKVDFLCGDFHWKKLWHLNAEPLYKYVGSALRAADAAACHPDQAGALGRIPSAELLARV